MAQTNIASEITRLTTDRNVIRTWLVTAGLVASTATLDDCADAVSAIINQGNVNATVKEGESFTINPGYYTGGSVSGVSGGGNYTVQAKTVTPTKSQQLISSDPGYYALSAVTVEAIPENYQDVSSVDAAAADVLANKKYVTANGTLTTGTMPNNGAVSKTLDTTTTSYTVPKGYHNGSGKVQVVTEDKTATPTEEEQVISASTGKVIKKITISPIPAAYANVGDATVTAGAMLSGTVAYGKDADGNAVKIVGVIATVNAVTAANGTIKANGSNYDVSGSYAQGGKYLASTGTATVSMAKTALGDAAAASVLTGSSFSSSNGIKVNGTMANNGDVSGTFDGLTTTSYTVSAGYTTGGTVSLTDDIENALKEI